MTTQFQEEDTQYSLRIGDTVLLYAKKTKGFVFSQLTSEQHNSVALFRTESLKDPNLPNVHFASFKVVSANKYKAQQELDAYKNKKARQHQLEDKEYSRLLGRVKHEEEDNRVEQERLKGSTLVYGDKIQLMHTASKKYLRVNSAETSRTENTSLRIELSSKNSEGCIFKILPRYKVRSVGDEVRYNDQVKFESLKTKGQFLHCSNHRYKDNFYVLKDCYELNLSATESALTIIPHYRPLPSHDPKALRGGSVVRLFHRENECYVCAEGSFADDECVVDREDEYYIPSKESHTDADVVPLLHPENEPAEGSFANVHCRKRPSKFGQLKHPSTSANVYWQFERESDGRSGEPLSWGERCRIKHLPSRRYLAVVNNEVTLKKISGEYADLETVFSLFPVIKEKETILVESYARIKHLQTRTWLHLDKGIQLKRASLGVPDEGGLQWDDAKLCKLTVTEVMNYDDAFTLEPVAEQLMDNFNFVAGIVPILTSHVEKYGGESPPPLESESATLVCKALENLSDFLSTSNARENKNRQKLLRNLKVLECIKDMLGLFQRGASDESEQNDVCKGCYQVIERYLKGNSRKNENYLAKFINFFKTQVGMGLNAEEVMIEMVEDNSAIVSKMSSENEIDYVIKQLHETKDPRFMDFLGNLCVCEGQAIPSTQNMILNKLVYQHGEDVFYTTTVGGSTQYPEGDKSVVYVSRPGNPEWSVLSDAMKEGKWCVFLESQLNLFARMCWGNNGTTIYALGKDDQLLITFEEILICAKNTALKPSLRSKYVRLMTVMYVDIEDNRNVLENLSLSFVYDDVYNPQKDTGRKGTIAMTGVENVNFPSMRDWIKEHLENAAHRKVAASEMEENALLADVIQVLKLLVEYGYYDDHKDSDDLLRHLLDVLNGFTDLPFRSDKESEEYDEEFTKTGRYKETAENKPIFDIKARIMEVIDLSFNFQVYIRLQQFVCTFRSLELKQDKFNQPEHSTLERLATKRALEQALAQCRQPSPPDELSGLLNASVDTRSKNASQQMTELTRERLHYIFSQSTYHFEISDHFFENAQSERKLKLSDILIDLSQYADPRLLQMSLHLLNRFYSNDAILFEKALQTQLLSAPKSCEVFNDVRELLPILQYHMNVGVGLSSRTEIIKLLRRLTKLCYLDDYDESHQQNQKILYTSGLFSSVLSYVLQISKHDTLSMMCAKEDSVKPKGYMGAFKRQRTAIELIDGDGASVNTLCTECFKFLKALAKDFFEVQERLYDVMDNLLDVDVGIASMAEVVAEIFIGRPELCLRVREDQITKIFSRITLNKLQEGRPELLYVLQTMAKVETLDLVVKRNQAFIVTHFSKTRKQFCDHLLGEGAKELASLDIRRRSSVEESKRKHSKLTRMQLLIKATRSDADLCLLLSLTDLLASCAEGENPSIESVCQTIFSIEEIFEIIACDFIAAERKRPFARFLVSVYLTSTSGKYSLSLPMIRDLINSKMEEFDCLGFIASYLSNLGEVLRTLPSSEKGLVRQGLSSVHRRYYYSQSSKEKVPTPHSASKSVPFITDENGQLLPGVLLYFSDGLLPLLRAYYKNFFHKSLPSGNKPTFDIATALLEMAGALVEHLTTDTMMKLYRGTVLTVLEKCGEELKIDVKVLTEFETKTRDCSGHKTLTKRMYNNTYATEIELNKAFKIFVTNFKHAYEGPNTAVAQVGSTITTCYSEDIEPLPLGVNFQQHVACFVDVHAKKQYDVVRPCVERLLAQLECSFHRLKDLGVEERKKQNKLDVKSLQIMRAIIHKEIVNIDPDLKDRNPPHYRKRCRSRIHPLQNSIQDMGNAVTRVLPLLSHPSEEILHEVLAFFKTMFYSGNRHVQEGMNTVFDTREETVFKIIGSLLQKAATMLNERRSLLGQAEAKYEDERMLKSNALAIINGQKHQPSTASDDLVIEIEVGSPGYAVSSTTQLVEEGNDVSESQITEREPHVTFKPTRQASATKDIELEVLERSSASDHDDHEQSIKAIERVLSKYKDSHHIKLALQVLGLTCDGQYRKMQNYLREQRDNYTGVNVVAEVAALLQNFSLDVDRETMDLVHLTLQTLIEMCVGNYPNQHVIYHRQIMEALNYIFALKVYNANRVGNALKEDTIKDSVHVKGSAIELLDVMLEETDESSKDLVRDIVNNLDIEALHHTLVEFYELMNDQKVKEQGYDDEAEKGLFHTYHALVHITDYRVPPEKIKPKLSSSGEVGSEHINTSESEKLLQVWKFCENQSKNVEVLYENMNGCKILTRIHFRFDPHQELREEVIEKIKWNIRHDSPEDKLRDLLQWMKAVKRDTVHSARLQKFLPTRILTLYPSQRHILLVLWSILMNIFILMAFVIPKELSSSPFPFSFSNASGAIHPEFLSYWGQAYSPVLYTFGSVHLLLSIWMFLEYFIVNLPNFKLPSFYYSVMTRFTRKEAPVELYTDISVFGLRTIYVVVFLVCSILSLIFYGYFYCVCLLHIIVNNDILQRVLKSVTKKGKSLLWVAALGLVILYIYSVVSFAFLHESFKAQGETEAILFCSTLYECFVSTIRYGLIEHIGLMVPLVPKNFQVSALRLLYDISFFIIITIIGLNIVFGIIVDTFSELRDERFRSEQDKKCFCFICNIASHEFERRANGFNHHTQNDHNMWEYIYLSIYLDQIDISDHNAIQKYVYDMIAMGKHDFFPLFHALALDEGEDKQAKQLDDVKTMVERILKRFEEEELKKLLRSKRQEQRKWEEENLHRGVLFDGGIPADNASSPHPGQLHPQMASLYMRQPSADYSLSPQPPHQEPHSDELSD